MNHLKANFIHLHKSYEYFSPIARIQHNIKYVHRVQFVNEGNGTAGELMLEKILEEDGNYCDERLQREYFSSEHDKKHLLANGHTITVHVT